MSIAYKALFTAALNYFKPMAIAASKSAGKEILGEFSRIEEEMVVFLEEQACPRCGIRYGCLDGVNPGNGTQLGMKIKMRQHLLGHYKGK